MYQNYKDRERNFSSSSGWTASAGSKGHISCRNSCSLATLLLLPACSGSIILRGPILQCTQWLEKAFPKGLNTKHNYNSYKSILSSTKYWKYGWNRYSIFLFKNPPHSTLCKNNFIHANSYLKWPFSQNYLKFGQEIIIVHKIENQFYFNIKYLINWWTIYLGICMYFF